MAFMWFVQLRTPSPRVPCRDPCCEAFFIHRRNSASCEPTSLALNVASFFPRTQPDELIGAPVLHDQSVLDAAVERLYEYDELSICTAEERPYGVVIRGAVRNAVCTPPCPRNQVRNTHKIIFAEGVFLQAPLPWTPLPPRV